MTGVQVNVTQYTVNAVPETVPSINRYPWEITVEYRGDDAWAVLHHGYCLGSDGEWEFEPRPSSRTDEWKATHRFEREAALRLAVQAAPDVVVNGLRAADVEGWQANHRRADT